MWLAGSKPIAHKPIPDSSMLAPDCTDLTSGDQCKVMRIAGYTGGASILTNTLDVVNGSVSFIGSLPNCSAASCAVDGTPRGMSHDCNGIAFFWNLVKLIVQTVTRPSTSYLPPCLVDPINGFLVSDTTPFYPVGKVLSCPSSALLDDDTVEGLDCSFFYHG